MRWKAWWLAVALASIARASPGHDHLHHRARGPAPTRAAPRNAGAFAFLPPRGPLSWFSSPAPATWSPGSKSAAARLPCCRHRRHRSRTWLPPSPPSRAGTTTRGKHRSSAIAMNGIVLPSDDASSSNSSNNNSNNSPLLQAGLTVSGGGGGVALWLDMRTAVLPAALTLKGLYDDLRQREEALGRSPGDPDWSLGRVPNPVGALFYAAEPPERAAEEMEALGGGGALPCFRLSGTGEGRVFDASNGGGGVVGVALDPAGSGGGGSGGNPAVEIVAAAQQADSGSLVLLRGVRPSVWDGGDMGTVLQIAASACAGAGKTLVVTVRSVGQLHDAAMAAFAASQTQVLGGRSGDERAGEGGSKPVVLLIEPLPELWEAGLLYL